MGGIIRTAQFYTHRSGYGHYTADRIRVEFNLDRPAA
jgi:hypothetical protein